MYFSGILKLCGYSSGEDIDYKHCYIFKDHFFKVDLEISNNPKICGFLPIFFVNKTDQILSQFQFSKGITIFLILFA